jgi:hypothetical protein
VHIDSLEVNIVDSFVSRPNKTGTGNGETRLYVGARKLNEKFFGEFGFKVPVRIKRSELIRFMEEMRDEYKNPTLQYRGKEKLSSLYDQRLANLKDLPAENIEFYIYDTQRKSKTSDKQRIYIDSDDPAYHLLHELPLSGTTRLSVVKYLESGRELFEFKLIPDFEGYTNPPASIQISRTTETQKKSRKMESPIETSVERLIQARIGQVNFRRGLLSSKNSFCAFTGVNEASLLIAGHIKPWRVCNNDERLDVQNGILFTPTFDRLFNNGYISFTENRKLMISPLLNRKTCKLLKLEEGIEIPIPINGRSNNRRRNYLEFHREKVFRE